MIMKTALLSTLFAAACAKKPAQLLRALSEEGEEGMSMPQSTEQVDIAKNFWPGSDGHSHELDHLLASLDHLGVDVEHSCHPYCPVPTTTTTTTPPPDSSVVCIDLDAQPEPQVEGAEYGCALFGAYRELSGVAERNMGALINEYLGDDLCAAVLEFNDDECTNECPDSDRYNWRRQFCEDHFSFIGRTESTSVAGGNNAYEQCNAGCVDFIRNYCCKPYCESISRPYSTHLCGVGVCPSANPNTVYDCNSADCRSPV